MTQRSHVFAALFVLLFAAGCATSPPSTLQRAGDLARNNLIIDTHIDVPYRLRARPADVSEATEGGDFDYPRAIAGGLNAPFMSIYVPASYEASGGSKALAEELIVGVEAMVASAPEKFAIATSTRDVEQQFEQGLISLPLGMENGSPIEGDLANLDYFYRRGIRYITLAHSLSNHISDSSYDINRQWQGLSPFGEEVIAEMNRLGIMIDISHVSDEAFYDVLALTKVPVLASHSSARHFTKGWERNMSDEMIKALAENGGVIQINFGSSFVTEAAREYSDKFNQERLRFMLEHEYDFSAPEVRQFTMAYRETSPYPFATLEEVLQHFDHVVALVGVDYVGIGSDYDGVGDSLPTDLKDVSTYPNLVAGLLDRGYSDEDIIKILSGNTMRVWREVEAYAEAQVSDPAAVAESAVAR